MIPAKHNLNWYQGATNSFRVQLKNKASGEPYNLTDVVDIRMQLRSAPAVKTNSVVYLTLSKTGTGIEVVNAAQGIISVKSLPTDLLEATWTEANYDLDVVWDETTTLPYLTGVVKLTPDYTR